MGTWDEWDALLAEDDPDPLEVLRLASTYRRYLGAVERRAAMTAHAAGHSWEDIGRALGVRRQAAWQRLRDRPKGRRAGPIADLASSRVPASGATTRPTADRSLVSARGPRPPRPPSRR